MNADAIVAATERRIWGTAGAVALGVHVAAIALLFAWVRPSEPPVPEPVVLIDMPPEAASATPSEAMSQPQPLPEPVVAERPPVDIPAVKAPLPADPMVLPPPQPVRPAQSTPTPAMAPSSVPVSASASMPNPTPGSDPRARKQEADYFALLAAHLNRRKSYPVEAKKARQQGIVTIRFTVDREGRVSNASIKRGSGHDVLDRETLDLLQRVAPLPRMPASMDRDSITLSLPIEYALRTN